MAKKEVAKPNSVKPKRRFLSRTKSYLAEYLALQVSNLWIGIAFIVATFSLFSIASGDAIVSDSLGGLAWVFGLLLVFAPMSVVFYARTTGEEIANPARVKQTLRAVMFYILLSIVLLSGLTFLVIAAFSLSRVLFGLDDTKNLLNVAAPCFVVLLMHIYFAVFVLKPKVTTRTLRKFNTVILAGLGVIISVAILSIAVSSGSNARSDKQIVRDLRSASSQINKEFRRSGSLPENVRSVSGLSEEVKLKFESGEYSYKPSTSVTGYDEPTSLEGNTSSSAPDTSVRQRGDYQLCAKFKSASDDRYYESYSTSYPSTRSPENHSKGLNCFDYYAY